MKASQPSPECTFLSILFLVIGFILWLFFSVFLNFSLSFRPGFLGTPGLVFTPQTALGRQLRISQEPIDLVHRCGILSSFFPTPQPLVPSVTDFASSSPPCVPRPLLPSRVYGRHVSDLGQVTWCILWKSCLMDARSYLWVQEQLWCPLEIGRY